MSTINDVLFGGAVLAKARDNEKYRTSILLLFLNGVRKRILNKKPITNNFLGTSGYDYLSTPHACRMNGFRTGRKIMDIKFEELIGSFMESRTGICERFMSGELAGRLRENLLQLDQTDRMKPAGIGNQTRDPTQTTRGDKVSWIDPLSNEVSERAFLDQIENFIGYLNDSCYTGINAYEFHYALYETGSSYKRHVDQFSNNSDRKFSMIHYLNDAWLPEDGGELWIHHPGKLEKIQPNIRKAVFFQSDECEHEVREASRPRMSITGWLKST